MLAKIANLGSFVCVSFVASMTIVEISCVSSHKLNFEPGSILVCVHVHATFDNKHTRKRQHPKEKQTWNQCFWGCKRKVCSKKNAIVLQSFGNLLLSWARNESLMSSKNVRNLCNFQSSAAWNQNSRPQWFVTHWTGTQHNHCPFFSKSQFNSSFFSFDLEHECVLLLFLDDLIVNVRLELVVTPWLTIFACSSFWFLSFKIMPDRTQFIVNTWSRSIFVAHEIANHHKWSADSMSFWCGSLFIKQQTTGKSSVGLSCCCCRAQCCLVTIICWVIIRRMTVFPLEVFCIPPQMFPIVLDLIFPSTWCFLCQTKTSSIMSFVTKMIIACLMLMFLCFVVESIILFLTCSKQIQLWHRHQSNHVSLLQMTWKWHSG